MAIPTVEEAINEASFHLGDMKQRRFNSAELSLAVGMAWRETISEMKKCGVATAELQTLYTLPASPTAQDVLPATMLIDNFGALVRLRERPSGTTLPFFPVQFAEILPEPWAAINRVFFYMWRNSTFTFPPTSAAVQLEVTYLESGTLPVTGSLGIDDCLTVVAKLAAAIAGPPKGLNDIPRRLRKEVYGDPGDRGATNDMQALIQPILRMQQERRIQPAAYSVGHNQRRALPPFYIVS